MCKIQKNKMNKSNKLNKILKYSLVPAALLVVGAGAITTVCLTSCGKGKTDLTNTFDYGNIDVKDIASEELKPNVFEEVFESAKAENDNMSDMTIGDFDCNIDKTNSQVTLAVKEGNKKFKGTITANYVATFYITSEVDNQFKTTAGETIIVSNGELESPKNIQNQLVKLFDIANAYKDVGVVSNFVVKGTISFGLLVAPSMGDCTISGEKNATVNISASTGDVVGVIVGRSTSDTTIADFTHNLKINQNVKFDINNAGSGKADGVIFGDIKTNANVKISAEFHVSANNGVAQGVDFEDIENSTVEIPGTFMVSSSTNECRALYFNTIENSTVILSGITGSRIGAYGDGQSFTARCTGVFLSGSVIDSTVNISGFYDVYNSADTYGADGGDGGNAAYGVDINAPVTGHSVINVSGTFTIHSDGKAFGVDAEDLENTSILNVSGIFAILSYRDMFGVDFKQIKDSAHANITGTFAFEIFGEIPDQKVFSFDISDIETKLSSMFSGTPTVWSELDDESD
ncbi:hypothetical protein FACS189459_4870 [Bacilli bacterium]|nr:hypothetical protein FACS189459_4870 [Bacilli bacterium]